jgi:2-(1,2-epoxy-1,2-dihydrophenyl)acetyl-CoA isomerase
MSEFELLEFQVDEGIATIRLSRPDAANAFNLTLVTELNHAATRCQQDPDVRVVVLGTNGKLFSAGGDLSVMSEAGDQVRRSRSQCRQAGALKHRP